MEKEKTVQPKKKSSFVVFAKKFCQHKIATVALIVLLIEVLLLLILPLVMDLRPNDIDRTSFGSPPSSTHLFGTDDVGRDVFARVISGGRLSLFIGLMSTLVSVAIGLPLGLLAGYYRGIVETLVMRALDVFQSFPTMVLLLVLSAIFGSSVPMLIIAIGVLGWTSPAKLIYGKVLSVRNKEYVESARAIGTRDIVILTKYVLPNAISPLWMTIAFRVSHAVITESALSFLGGGVKIPQASWGNIIKSAENMMILRNSPWMWLPAGICLLVTVICTNLIGEGVRDALDPKMKR